MKTSFDLSKEACFYTAMIETDITNNPKNSPIKTDLKMYVPRRVVEEALADSLEASDGSNQSVKVNYQGYKFPVCPYALPWDKGSRPFLTYNRDSKSFAHRVRLCTLDLTLPKSETKLEADVWINWTVNPEKYPFLKRRMLAGEELVLRQADLGQCSCIRA